MLNLRRTFNGIGLLENGNILVILITGKLNQTGSLSYFAKCHLLRLVIEYLISVLHSLQQTLET